MLQNQEQRLQVFINSQSPLDNDPGDSMVCQRENGGFYRVHCVAYHYGMEVPAGFDTIVFVIRKVVSGRAVAILKECPNPDESVVL